MCLHALPLLHTDFFVHAQQFQALLGQVHNGAV